MAVLSNADKARGDNVAQQRHEGPLLENSAHHWQLTMAEN